MKWHYLFSRLGQVQNVNCSSYVDMLFNHDLYDIIFIIRIIVNNCLKIFYFYYVYFYDVYSYRIVYLMIYSFKYSFSYFHFSLYNTHLPILLLKLNFTLCCTLHNIFPFFTLLHTSSDTSFYTSLYTSFFILLLTLYYTFYSILSYTF